MVLPKGLERAYALSNPIFIWTVTAKEIRHEKVCRRLYAHSRISRH
jgi:hypothetical protein